MRTLLYNIRCLKAQNITVTSVPCLCTVSQWGHTCFHCMYCSVSDFRDACDAVFCNGVICLVIVICTYYVLLCQCLPGSVMHMMHISLPCQPLISDPALQVTTRDHASDATYPYTFSLVFTCMGSETDAVPGTPYMPCRK